MVSNRGRLTVVLVVVAFIGVAYGTGCAVSLPNVPKGMDPLYLTRNEHNRLVLFEPTGKVTPVGSGEEVILECPAEVKAPGGNKNNFKSKKNAKDPPPSARGGAKNIFKEISCNTHSKFDTAVNSVTCPKRVDAELIVTERPCGITANEEDIDGVFYEIGFKVEQGQNFIKLYEICYDRTAESVIFSHHVINGKAIKGECLECDFD